MQITSRLKAVSRWFRDAWYGWLSWIIIVVALSISLRPHTTELSIRLTGLVLQVLGIGTVMWGIHETRALFGHPSFMNKIKTYLSSFPLLRHHVVSLSGTASLETITSKARMHQTYGLGANPTIEARLDVLEKNVVSIHERINQTQKEMDGEFQKTADAIKHEVQLRQAEDSAIRERLEATGTGGVHISAVGASLLLVGVILSTGAMEIAEIVNGHLWKIHDFPIHDWFPIIAFLRLRNTPVKNYCCQ